VRRSVINRALGRAIIFLSFGISASLVSALWWAVSGEPSDLAYCMSNAWDITVLEHGDPNATVYANSVALSRSLHREPNEYGLVFDGREIDYHRLPDREAPVPHMRERFGKIGRSTDLFQYGPFDGYKANPEALTNEDSILEYAYGWPRLSLFSRYRVIDGQFQTERGIELNDSVLGVNLPSGYVVVPTGIIWNGLAVNTLTFACLSWGVVSIAISARRYSRFTRGRCPRCRYDLRHDFSHGCPECGWRKERGFGGPDGESATEAAAASA